MSELQEALAELQEIKDYLIKEVQAVCAENLIFNPTVFTVVDLLPERVLVRRGIERNDGKIIYVDIAQEDTFLHVVRSSG